jgi:hypothetical protein
MRERLCSRLGALEENTLLRIARRCFSKPTQLLFKDKGDEGIISKSKSCAKKVLVTKQTGVLKYGTRKKAMARLTFCSDTYLRKEGKQMENRVQ